MKQNICIWLSGILLTGAACAQTDLPDDFTTKLPASEPKINVQIYIPSLLFGVVSGDVNVKVTDKFSLGPQFNSFSYGRYRGYSAGLTANYALGNHQVFDDRIWLLNPHIGYSYDNVFDNDANKKSAINGGVNLVYQWLWDSGINTKLGVGINCSSNKPWNSISDTHVGAVALFSLGYAF